MREEFSSKQWWRSAKLSITYFLFVVFLILNQVSGDEWVQRKITPSTQLYTAGTWVDDSTIVLVSADDTQTTGYVQRSTDYGVTWSRVRETSGRNFSAIYGISSRTINSTAYAYVVDFGNRGIYRSINTGSSWTLINTVSDVNLYGVAIGSNGYVYASGQFGSVFRSTVSSASASWDTVSIVVENDDVVGDARGISTVDGNSVVLVTSSGYIYYTRNAGTSWVLSTSIVSTSNVTSSSASSSLFCVSFATSSVVYAAGGNGIIYKSSDAGFSWQELISPLSGSTIQGISLLDASTIYVGAYNGNLYSSSNGGQSWTLEFSVSTIRIQSVTMLSTSRGVIGANTGNSVYALVPSK